MSITYIPPPKIEVQDDGSIISSDVDILDFTKNLKVINNGGGKTSIDGYLPIFEDGYLRDNAYTLNFDSKFDTSTDGYGNVSVALSSSSNKLSLGFTWGRSGNVGNGAYLLNDTVPSNLTGRVVPMNAAIVEVIVGNEALNTFNIDIQKNIAGVWTTILTVNMVNQRLNVFTTNISLSIYDELAVRISPGIGNASKNPVVGLVLQGI